MPRWIVPVIRRCVGITLVTTVLLTTTSRAQPRRADGNLMPNATSLTPMLTIPATGEQVPPPTTDAEAERLLNYATSLLTATMIGLYRVYRAQGQDVRTAYRATLEALETAPRASRTSAIP